ncbi:hypothetical protein Q4E93_19990 [Flavitalea sp. BT771]|uniref:hypothetical protein n=1 Tax=Flavitalea sp. BT771 TaxID=3063329 RepID=UPI0026E3ECCD|nr:hypothetical protein [Flavitalea sp. BT771]MDO6432900.1 hypothetical protein [Flavitalea sp. BT771]MDV6221824.1 hypothetical protein [Flavitalea sp. BT771]
MKQLLSLMIAAFASTISFCQQPTKPVKTGNEWKMPADVFQRSAAYAGRLKATLHLDAAQTKKVYDAYLANIKSVDEISVIPDEAAKKMKMKANQASFNEVLKGIFSSAQFQKYLQDTTYGHHS